ncbi:MAG: hypothetical protein IJF66_03240 [Clostridia bacterium]|nr:hypothetical protein [Clostridia bacterium]
MVKIKAINTSIEISCKPIIPCDFKYRMLNKIAVEYILKSDDKIILKFDKSEINNETRVALQTFYQQNDFEYSFEEFIELEMFPISTLEVYDINNDKIAFIDFMPDGDVDSVWIDVYSKEHQLKLVGLIKGVI